MSEEGPQYPIDPKQFVDNPENKKTVPVTESNYEQLRGHCLTSHWLGLFRKSPAHFKAKCDGLIPDKDSHAFSFGRAFDCYLLESEKFQKRYHIGGPINPSTGKPYGRNTEKYAKWQQEHPGCEAISHEDFETIKNMKSRTLDIASNLVGRVRSKNSKQLGPGHPQHLISSTIAGIRSMCRIDMYRPADNGSHYVVDVKTCQNLDWFEADAKRYGYIWQLAFYGLMIIKDQGLVLKDGIQDNLGFYFVAVEKNPPYRAGVWYVIGDVMNDYMHRTAIAIKSLHECIESDRWPTGYEYIRMLTDARTYSGESYFLENDNDGASFSGQCDNKEFLDQDWSLN